MCSQRVVPHRAVAINGAELTIADVESVAREGRWAVLDPAARERVLEARLVIARLVERGEVVYGVTTGFGALASTFVPPERARELQERLLLSHAAGVGAPLPTEVVRAMLLLRANTLALGHSGCRPELIERLLDLLRLGIHPIVPAQGSVGASGDLAPLAHLALPVIGRGQVEVDGRIMDARAALARAGLEPLVLEPKEGLALLNGTQMMSAIGALLLASADRLARTASVAAAISVEALRGTQTAYSAALQSTRPHPGQVQTAAELRWLLRGSSLQQAHHHDAHRVQDPYSLRCVPQVHGAARDALDQLRRVLDIELNSATDNPLVFPQAGGVLGDGLAGGPGLVISGGNFHGEPVALALDYAKLGIAELGAISERRVALLLDPRLNDGLPAFLGASSGLDSGLMILQYTAAALASESKVLAHPASVDSIPTSANQEDHVSMGSIAARNALTVLEHSERIIAIELICASQGLDLRLGLQAGTVPGAGVAEAHARVRRRIARLDHDREPGADLEAAFGLVREGQLADLAGPPVTPGTSWLGPDPR